MKILQFVTPAFLALAIGIPSWSAEIDTKGLRNFHQVNENIYRGGQPSAEGWQKLAKLGIKTVIDLRRPTEHDTIEEERLVKAAGMRYVNVPMRGIWAPTEEQVSKVLALLNSKEAGPVFVHCKRGADRTGTIIACYRMGRDGWNNEKAAKVAKSLGMRWTQIGMKQYISSYKPPVQNAANTAAAGATP